MNSVTGLNLCRFLLIVFINCFHFVYSRNLSKEVWSDMRLANGRTVFEGRVEVKINGTWGTVCDDSWSNFDGFVVCRQLGFDNVATVTPGGYFGQGTGPIFHDDLNCRQNDTSLDECVGLHDPSLTDCNHAEDAGVRCSIPAIKSYKPRCTKYQYKCFANNLCIPKRWVCDGQYDCPDHSDENSVLCQSARCGLQTILPVSPRIVGGTNAITGSWPWMASIQVIFPSGIPSKTLCGGTLISKEWVVTAAHCFDQYKPTSSYFHVVLGDYNNRLNETTEQNIPIRKVFIPSTYVVGRHRDDIALIQLEQPATFQISSVNAACLARMIDEPFNSSDTCYITGWGYSSATASRPSQVLQQAQVPIIDTSLCNTWYNNTLTPGVLCAGYQYGGIDACKGDSGGPLSCKRGSRWYLAGVISWGNGCAEAFHPGIYTDVSHYIEWIAGVIITSEVKKNDVEIIGR